MSLPNTIVEAAAQLRSGGTTATALVEASLDRIAADGARTNAFIRVDGDAARRAAEATDSELHWGVDRGPLHGIPISLKDLIDVAGEPTTAASRVFADRIAAADAPIVTRLREAGAILIGKTNLHEFALGTTCEDSGWGPVRHPADESRSPGGSSGGSAVAVATGMGLASIGSDTGGSIRIPAGACGIVGLKPSYGEVSTDGVVPLSVTLDHVGPLARTVADAHIVWRVLVGRPVTEMLRAANPAALRLAVLDGYFAAPLAPEVRAAFDAAVAALSAAGVATIRATLAETASIADTYVKLALPEAASWHARYLKERPGDYTPNVRARLESGLTITAVDYIGARVARAALRHRVDALFFLTGGVSNPPSIDALILPTLPIVAPTLGAAEVEVDGQTVPVRIAMLKHTQTFNITGHPAISLPLPVRGLPIGLQIVGPHGQTARLLAIAAACEKILAQSPT